MYSVNASRDYGGGGSAMNKEIAFKVALPEQLEASAIEVPIGRSDQSITVVIAIRVDDNGKPGHILREAFAGVHRIQWHRFEFAPVVLESGKPYWVSWKGIDPTNTGGTVIAGPGFFVSPLTSDDAADSAEEYILTNRGWDGPYSLKPIIRIL